MTSDASAAVGQLFLTAITHTAASSGAHIHVLRGGWSATTEGGIQYRPSWRPSSNQPSVVDPGLAETLEILSDPDFVQDMSDGLEDIAAGNVVSLVEFKRIVDKLNQ